MILFVEEKKETSYIYRFIEQLVTSPYPIEPIELVFHSNVRDRNSHGRSIQFSSFLFFKFNRRERKRLGGEKKTRQFKSIVGNYIQ